MHKPAAGANGHSVAGRWDGTVKSELNDHHLNTDWGSMIDGMSSRQRVRLKPQGVWERLERLEMSQNTLARRIGVTQGFLSLMMNGRRSPSTETIGSMLKELDAPFDDLFVVVAREDIRREPARPKRRSNGNRNGRSNRDGKQLALPGLNVLPPGTTILPDNFPIRLVRIKEATGLTWNEFGEKVGVNPRQMLRWRNGAKPSGGAMYSLMRVAMTLPNGYWLLYGDLNQPPPNGSSPSVEGA